MDNDKIEICLDLIPTPVDKAIRVNDGMIETWLPLSEIEYEGDLQDKIEECQATRKIINLTLSVPVWLAKRKGFV